MATLKTLRRSVSPFGFKIEALAGPFFALETEFERVFGNPNPDEKHKLDSFAKAAHVPFFINKLYKAAANDAPDLELVCQFLLTHKVEFESKGLDRVLFDSMVTLFEQKTELFLIDHQNKETLEKLGLEGEFRDMVLFAKERDALVGHYFAPLTEKNPGLFSEFVNRWVGTENLDRILHFLDFSAGAQNPTFEYYLVFADPSLKRVVTNKTQMRSLIKMTEPLLKKIASPTWEPALRKALEI